MIAATGTPNSAVSRVSTPPPGAGVRQRRRKLRQRKHFRDKNLFALDSHLALMANLSR
jgi:hypothetical protein